MKTKIIYISGSEIFEMADVRAALEEVRGALNLSRDTILFGVPVDAESAFAATTDNADVVATVTAHVAADDVVADVADAPHIDEIVDTVADAAPDVAPAGTTPTEEAAVVEEAAPVETPAPKKRATRARKAKKEEAAVSDADATADAATSVESAPIPILSVLAAKTDPVVEDMPSPDVEDTDNVTEEVAADTENIEDTEDIENALEETPVAADEPVVTLVQEVKEEVVVETVALDDMIDDDMPVDAGEKTLEELLESMKPLREDMPKAPVVAAASVDDDFSPIDISADTDATLEQLAAEFAQNEDKIGDAPKQAGRGKIGKLKNILPFKKVKRDDNGLMGDLF